MLLFKVCGESSQLVFERCALNIRVERRLCVLKQMRYQSQNQSRGIPVAERNASAYVHGLNAEWDG